MMSKTDQMFETLGRAIVVGEFDASFFSSELILEKHYQVSRSVAREAVRMLRAKGVISSSTKQGICLEPMDRWNLLDPDVLRWIAARPFSSIIHEELIQLRLAIEPRAAGLAARFVSLDIVRALQFQYYNMLRHKNDHQLLTKAKIAFHTEIIEASGNRFLKNFRELVAMTLTWQGRAIKVGCYDDGDFGDYMATIEAVENGNSDLSEASMKHIVLQQLR